MFNRSSIFSLFLFSALNLSAVDCSNPSNSENKDCKPCSAKFHDSWCPVEIDLSLAVDDFRSLPEGSWEGNMGAFTSANFKAYLPQDFAVQLGGSYGLYDWGGRSSTPSKNSSSLQQQGFITGAATRENPCGWGVNAGIAYDWMLNKNFGMFAVNPYIDQLRGQVGYVFNGSDELGVWGTYGIRTSDKESEELPLKFRGISQANLFYCHYFKNNSYGMIWGGTPYRRGLMYTSGRPGRYTIGTRFSAPLAHCLSINGHAAYMGGRSTSTSSKSQNYAANVCFSLTYSFGYRKVMQTPYMSLADNSNFLVDTNQNF